MPVEMNTRGALRKDDSVVYLPVTELLGRIIASSDIKQENECFIELRLPIGVRGPNNRT